MISIWFQKEKKMSGFSTVKVCSIRIIYSLGQGKFSSDKYIMAIYLSVGKYQIVVSTPLVNYKYMF